MACASSLWPQGQLLWGYQQQPYMVTKVAKLTLVFTNPHVLFPATGTTQLMQAVAARGGRCPGSW